MQRLLPRIFFENLSGIRWTYKRISWWYFAIYTPWFGCAYNIHPNRFRQIWRDKSF